MFTKVNIAPKPLTKEYLVALLQMVSKASLAAGQNDFPVNAIYIYAFLFKNSINLSKHATIQERHDNKHYVILLSPDNLAV